MSSLRLPLRAAPWPLLVLLGAALVWLPRAGAVDADPAAAPPHAAAGRLTLRLDSTWRAGALAARPSAAAVAASAAGPASSSLPAWARLMAALLLVGAGLAWSLGALRLPRRAPAPGAARLDAATPDAGDLAGQTLRQAHAALEQARQGFMQPVNVVSPINASDRAT